MNKITLRASVVVLTVLGGLAASVGSAFAQAVPPEDSVGNAVETFGGIFSNNWEKFALLAAAVVAVSIAVALFRRALQAGKKAATGKAPSV